MYDAPGIIYNHTVTSLNEISSKADICVGDMEHTHQGMLHNHI